MVTKSFEYDGHTLVYDEYGSGEKVVVLLPGLLLSRKMQRPLAEEVADRGHRVLSLDLLGHGESDRPPEMWNYGMTAFGHQTIALLDHAGIDQAVVGGTSLGANVTLEATAAAPERVRGMLVEMPVLDNALLGCALAFTPLLVGLTFGAPVARAVGAATRGARHDDPEHARDRPLPRPDPPLLGLGHARPRAAEREARAGLLDPRAAADSRAAD